MDNQAAAPRHSSCDITALADNVRSAAAGRSGAQRCSSHSRTQFCYAQFTMSDDTSLPGNLEHDSNPRLPYSDNVPDNLRAATSRLQFPPSYAVVGIYRLFTDKKIALPVWQKCKHGLVRGVSVALAWVSLNFENRVDQLEVQKLTGASQTVVTFKLQREFVELFLIKYAKFL